MGDDCGVGDYFHSEETFNAKDDLSHVTGMTAPIARLS
jgi:hypothetical protein